MSARPSASEAQRAAGKFPLRGYAFAFSASIAYSVSQILARHGVSDFEAPLIGTTIALAFASVGFIPIVLRNLDEPPESWRRGAFFFGLAGIFSAVGVASMFMALERSEVVIVSPVSSTNPLFALLFAAILLRDVERITLRVAAGSCIVVFGVVLISIS